MVSCRLVELAMIGDIMLRDFILEGRDGEVLARRRLAFSSYNRATATPGSPLWDTRDAQRNDAHPSVEFGGFESCERSRKRSSNIIRRGKSN